MSVIAVEDCDREYEALVNLIVKVKAKDIEKVKEKLDDFSSITQEYESKEFSITFFDVNTVSELNTVPF